MQRMKIMLYVIRVKYVIYDKCEMYVMYALYACSYVEMLVRKYVYMYMHAETHVIYIYIYVNMYARMHVSISVYVYVYI